jgi:hypothetical protein
MPGIKLIGVRVTLIRGPSEFVRSLVGGGGGEAVGAGSAGFSAISATGAVAKAGDETDVEVIDAVTED